MIEGDPEQFDCTTCELACALEALDDPNREAWVLFGQVISRLTMEQPGLAGAVLTRVMDHYSGDDATDLLQRLSIIYDVLIPAQPPPT